MNTTHAPTLEIETLDQWDDHARSSLDAAGWIIQSLDLSERGDDLARLDVDGAMFLGCTFADGDEFDLIDRGALVFPQLPHVPFNAYRTQLYSAAELYDAVMTGDQYAACTDAVIYSWSQSRPHHIDLDENLAMCLHDFAIVDALDDLLAQTRPSDCVGILGGHAMTRGADDYVGAARLGSQLALDGLTVLTGGGPGAMEAANLGAYFAGRYAPLSHAIDMLAAVPDYHGDPTAWIATALEVKAQFRPVKRSFGIPTWYFGHEPSNVFATHIAKLFSNAIREDELLQRCRGGLIYLPGRAGTVQEIFQATTDNYYSADTAKVTPMVFVGADYWRNDVPAWPLIESLARGRYMADRIALVDDVDEAVDAIASWRD